MKLRESLFSLILFIAVLSATGQTVTIDGTIRPRAEFRNGYKSLPLDDMSAAFAISQRTRLNALYNSNTFKAYISMQDIRVWGDVNQLDIGSSNKFALHQAWGEYFLHNGVSIKLGRQELVYDDSRIFGNVGWAQQARAHDLGLFKYESSNLKLHIGFAFNQKKEYGTEYFEGNYIKMMDIIYNEIIANGGKAIKSKKEHESGSDRIAEAVENLDIDIVVNVQGDEPFTKKEALSKLLEVFKTDAKKEIAIASLMLKMDDSAEINNPNNVKVVTDEQNFAMYFSRSPIPYPREKSTAIYYKHIGIYAFRKEALLKFTKLPINHLEATEKLENLRFLANGLKVKMVETNQIAIGIDTPEDLEKANEIFKSNL